VTEVVPGRDFDVESLGWALLEGHSSVDAIQVAQERRAAEVKAAAAARAGAASARARDDARLAAFETGMKLRRLLLLEQRRLREAMGEVHRASQRFDEEVDDTCRHLTSMLARSRLTPAAAEAPVIDVTPPSLIASDAAIDAWLALSPEEAEIIPQPPEPTPDSLVVVIGGLPSAPASTTPPRTATASSPGPHRRPDTPDRG